MYNASNLLIVCNKTSGASTILHIRASETDLAQEEQFLPIMSKHIGIQKSFVR